MNSELILKHFDVRHLLGLLAHGTDQ